MGLYMYEKWSCLDKKASSGCNNIKSVCSFMPNCFYNISLKWKYNEKYQLEICSKCDRIWFWSKLRWVCRKLSEMMWSNKLKHKVRGQILSRDVTFMSHRWLRYTMTAKHVNAAIVALLVWLAVKYCDMLHHFSAFVGNIMKHLFHENL